MRVVAITGFSGSGKTTLIVRLIERLVARGLTVGAIKHTHHAVNEEDRGDTAKFRRAGANPVILAASASEIPLPAPAGRGWRPSTSLRTGSAPGEGGNLPESGAPHPPFGHLLHAERGEGSRLEAVIFDRNGTTRITYGRPEQLLAHFATDVVLIEGFKDRGSWPRFEAGATTLEEVLGRIAGP